MSSIIFEGNTYTFGVTVSANPGTGTTSYVFGGLSSGWTYGFIIWAFNGFGNSNIVGPISIATLPILEERSIVAAFAWNWDTPILGGGSQDLIYYSAYGVTGDRDSASEINYYVSSENLGNTNWFSNPSPSTLPKAVPSWITLLSGITDPFGGTGAFIFRGFTNTSQTLRINQPISDVPAGQTYIMSMYINTSGVTSNWTVSNSWKGAFSSGSISSQQGITMTQILPTYGSYPSGSIAPTIQFPPGLSAGWHRFAWRFYASPILLTQVIGGTTTVSGITWENIVSTIVQRTFTAGVTQDLYIFGPQFELET
jgi:hypothetical protein